MVCSWFLYKDTQKFSDTLQPMRGKYLKRLLTCLYCNEYHKLIYVIQIHKSMFLIKNDTNAVSILYTDSHKSFPVLMGEMLKVYFNILASH